VLIEALQTLINALRPGALYALTGLGFVIVYLATGSINFAQGEFVVLGGLLCATLYTAGLAPVAAIAATLLVSLVLGYVFDRVLIRPLGKGAMVRTVIITIGASVLLRQIFLHVFGPDELSMPTLVKQKMLIFGPLRVEIQSLILVLVFAAVIVTFLLVYRYTRFGKSMRANEESPEGAVLVGVRPNQVVNRSFMLASCIGALCGILMTPLTQMTFDTGSGLGVKGFTAAILGGLANPVGVVVGGFLLGLIETVTSTYFNPLFKDAVALVILIATLIMRPSGLLGRKDKTKL
jgi:branched-chain amino acid transport system permease protein